MNNLKINKDDITCILFGESVYDSLDNEIFKWITETIKYTDIERGSIDKDVIIQEVLTGKYYKARLTESKWIHQKDQNWRAKWVQVFPKEKTIIVYE